MTVKALFFAHYQDIVGSREQDVTMPEGATVRDCAAVLARLYPRLPDLLSHGRAAVNAEFAGADAVLHDGDEIAFMPPMSGGAPGPPRVCLTRQPIDISAVSRSVEAAGHGAVVIFAGNVRDTARGRSVLSLEYEAYAPLAEKQLCAIAAEAEARWDVQCAITHRLGRLDVGECSVAVAVAAAHRAEAFEACRWAMDTLKATVPIWKKEYFDGGAHWVEGPEAVPSERPGRDSRGS